MLCRQGQPCAHPRLACRACSVHSGDDSDCSCGLCSRKWEDVSRLLSDVGLVLEYADLLSGHVEPASPCALQEAQLCLKHVAHLARKHLPFISARGWAALASKVRKLSLLPSVSHVQLSAL